MNWLSKTVQRLRHWLAESRRNPTIASTRKKRFVPRLEELESRVVPNVTYQGGALLAHVEVQSIFFGSNWAADPTLVAQSQALDHYTKYLVSSPYMDMLTKAGYNVGEGSFTAGYTDPFALTQNSSLLDSVIQSHIQSDISSHNVLPPDANRLYVFYVEPNIEVVSNSSGANSVSTFLGYHGNFTGSDGSGHAANIRYAVMAYPGGTINNASVAFTTTINEPGGNGGIGGIGANDTTMTVDPTNSFPAAPFTVTIDNEDIRVTAVTGGGATWTITRGYDGTTPAAHADQSSINGGIIFAHQYAAEWHHRHGHIDHSRFERVHHVGFRQLPHVAFHRHDRIGRCARRRGVGTRPNELDDRSRC
jgi:hypothetical protein